MITPVASLSMYDWPETKAAIDRLWTLISGNLVLKGVLSPPHLSRVDNTMQVWTNPALIVGQTCGWPYVTRLRGTAIPFARFHYELSQCPAGHYQSVYIGKTRESKAFVSSKEGLMKAGKIAINGDDSQSGFHVFKEITGMPAANAIPLEKRVLTGSHRASIQAVAEGKADIAAIDAVSFELANRYDRSIVDEVHVVGRSKPKPGLPLITANANAAVVKQLFETTTEAVEMLAEEDKHTLLINGVVAACDSDYEEFL